MNKWIILLIDSTCPQQDWAPVAHSGNRLSYSICWFLAFSVACPSLSWVFASFPDKQPTDKLRSWLYFGARGKKVEINLINE